MGLPIPLAMGLVGTKIYIVGASIARPFLTVSSVVTGLADAKDVSVQCGYATEKTTPPSRLTPTHLPLHSFLEAHGRSYGYTYCVSPVSRVLTKPQNCRFPILRCRFCSALPLPPLCKGRWVGVSRAGGVAYSNPCALRTPQLFIIRYSLFVRRRSLCCRATVINV